MKLTKSQRQQVRKMLNETDPGDIHEMVMVSLRLGRKFPIKYHRSIFNMVARYN